MAGVLVPTEAFVQKIYQYVAKAAPIDINVLLQKRLRRTKHNGSRSFGYTTTEWLALEVRLAILSRKFESNRLFLE